MQKDEDLKANANAGNTVAAASLSDFLSLFWAFFKIGFFTFGGGLAMIPFIEEEFVNKKKWISAEDMREMVILAQTLPGVIAVNVSIFVGQRRAGWLGAIAAIFGTVLPALLSIVLILVLLKGFEANRYVKMIFVGIKAGSAALILDTVIRMSRKTLGADTACWVVAALGLLIVIMGFSAAWTVVFGALAGLVYFYNRDNKPKP